MSTFATYTYQRPDLKKIKSDFESLLVQFEQADALETQNQLIAAINALRNDFESMQTLVHIRHTMDTADSYYTRENDYFDTARPIYEGLVHKFYQHLTKSPYRQGLTAKWGRQLFRIAELQLKTFSEAILNDLQTENRLSSEYTKLRASAQIMFEGKIRNLPQMTPFMESPDRDLRRRAQQAFTGFFAEHEAQFDDIYDRLVKVRDKIARKLGFKNFIPLAYARLSRSDYNSAMVANYRKQIRNDLIPLTIALRKRQAKRILVDRLMYYDEALTFLSGNALPKGDGDWIIETGRKMYRELSQKTHEFFEFMLEHQLMDLAARPGKAGGGYCTYIGTYKAPFIFSNFNGTSGDVDVLTHEAGHAFQVYASRAFEIPEYIWPTLEACEIHSMTMEFIAWPWMKLFFQNDSLKYQFAHLSEAVLFIPYGAAVDEFQHWIYENPGATPNERKQTWRSLEREYLPYRDYEDNDLLERGGYWFRQGHIFNNPFYYIDYTLAQVCAFQFWNRFQMDEKTAWRDYLNLCQAGGSQSFLELVKLANLKNPFDEGCIRKIMPPVVRWLNQVNDQML